jgi:hypothetical protein
MFCIHHTPEKNESTRDQHIHLFIDFKKSYDSIRSEALYNVLVLVDYGITMKLGGLSKVCLNESYSKVRKTV